MHEASIAESLAKTIDRAARDNRAGRVVSAQVRVGALTSIDPETLMFAFEVVTRDGPLHGCQLVIERVPLVVRCSQCGRESEVELGVLACGQCGASGLTVVTGREIELATIEVDD